MVGHAGAPEPSWLSCPSGALHIQGCPCGLGGPVCSVLLGFLFLSGLPWNLSPGVSVSGRVRQGERGAAVLEKTPTVSLLWRACPGTEGSPEGPRNSDHQRAQGTKDARDLTPVSVQKSRVKASPGASEAEDAVERKTLILGCRGCGRNHRTGRVF